MPGFKVTGSEPIGVNAKSEWLRSHRFYLRGFFGLSTQTNGLLAIKDVKLPDKMMSELKIETPGTTYSFAKQASYTDLEITFYGSEGILIKCLQLADKVHNTRDGLQDYNDYKGEVSLLLSTVGSSRSTGFIYRYINSYISSVKHGKVTYSSSEIFSITADIKFDYYDVTQFTDSFNEVVSSNTEPPDLLGFGSN